MKPMTAAERKAAQRARQVAQGLFEVRGIFAPKAQHQAIRIAAQAATGATKRKPTHD
jgi:hypothetical protein